jgi:tetratricopeptide (TPR) repeat protein
LEEKFQAIDALESLMKCSRCRPFIMPIAASQGREAIRQYDLLINACLQILFGWLLPRDGGRANVSVFLDRHEGHNPNADWYAGLFAGASQGAPGRFRRWTLEHVEWIDDDDFEYIPYADLLAYIAQEHTPRSLAVAEAANYKAWPGYVPLSLDLAPRLMRLDGLRSSANVADLLDVVDELQSAPLTEVVLADVKDVVIGNPDLQRRLLENLDERFHAKDRNLDRLRRQFDAVRCLVPEPGPDASARLSLLYTAVALQQANHDGNPDRVRPVTQKYMQARAWLADHDRELAAFVDLNLAVYHADRFEFTRAEELMEELKSSVAFAFLSPLMRAWVLSSLGQYRAMQGRHDDAELTFRESLSLYEKADLSAKARAAEKDQTACYRAINALDAGHATAIERVEEVLGPLTTAAANLGADGTGVAAYHHHLLLRTLWFRPDLIDTRSAYLATRPSWQTGIRHPWPLIDCYRALLLWKGGENEHADAEELLVRAIQNTQDSEHGVTLTLIGAMIVTVFQCANPNDVTDGIARKLLDQCRSGLPAAAQAVETLQAILDTPDADSIDMALAALPFNYH